MIIDAMDLLYTGRFTGFCIVSSDSDFARLAARIREQGVTVYGFGERKTPRPFITACDKFVYVDVLGEDRAEPPPEKAASTPKTVKPEADKDAAPQGVAASGKLDKAALAMLRKAVEASADDDGRAHLARVGAHLSKQSADFDARNYGYARLSDLAEASGILEVERVGGQNKIVTVKLKNG